LHTTDIDVEASGVEVLGELDEQGEANVPEAENDDA
jgi:hypothetical protein